MSKFNTTENRITQCSCGKEVIIHTAYGGKTMGTRFDASKCMCGKIWVLDILKFKENAEKYLKDHLELGIF